MISLTRRLGQVCILIVVAANVVLAQQESSLPPAPAEPEAASRHIQAAKLLAGDEYASVADGFLCRSPTSAYTYLLPYMLPLVTNTAELRVARAFDNLSYIGLEFVGTWVLETSDGLILFDTLFNTDDARDVIEVGFRELGLDPANIKHIVITHGHFDHYGGARYFQDKYGARVWLSAADWDLLEADKIEDAPEPLKHKFPTEKPLRDAIAEDGGILELGGQTVEFVLTPGHTPETVSAVISVLDNGIKRYISIWGGTAMPKDFDGVQQMHASLLKLWKAGQEAGAEGVISTHAFVEDSFGRFAKRETSKTNPFNLGRDGYNRIMAIHSECILAQAARYQAVDGD